MPDINSTYTAAEYELLTSFSKMLGFTPEAYQKYMSLLALTSVNPYNVTQLLSIMNQRLEQLSPASTFIVPALLPEEWVSLDRKQKAALASHLYNMVKSNPKAYKLNRVINNLNLYQKL